MLIGHNPALHELALDLACRSLTADELASKYPTAALAIFELSAWDELEHSTAELTALVRPRDLE